MINPAARCQLGGWQATTVAALGEDGWKTYWQELKDNGVKIAAGWEDAYFTDFSGSSGAGPRPIVLSYASSPSAEVRDNGESQTAALLDECFRQTEYAGVIANANNPTGAQAFIDFLLGDDFQSSVAESMYVYPVSASAVIPESWTKFAQPARSTVGDDLDFAANRDAWLSAWKTLFG